jgi:hypothetical protein
MAGMRDSPTSSEPVLSSGVYLFAVGEELDVLLLPDVWGRSEPAGVNWGGWSRSDAVVEMDKAELADRFRYCGMGPVRERDSEEPRGREPSSPIGAAPLSKPPRSESLLLARSLVPSWRT